MRAVLLALCLSACASTYVANPADPVDMSAELGNRARLYVGMGEQCGGDYRARILGIVETQQQRLGVLAPFVNRAQSGHASPELAAHMQTQLAAHHVTADQFCEQVTAQARAETSGRASDILAMRSRSDVSAQTWPRAAYPDMPSFDPELGYRHWME